jgi:hypothetical protein
MTTPKVPGFDRVMFTHQGRSHPVYRAGTGPAVIVIHEIPGIHPGMITFAQRLLEAGYRVYLPSLFGRPKAAPAKGGHRRGCTTPPRGQSAVRLPLPAATPGRPVVLHPPRLTRLVYGTGVAVLAVGRGCPMGTMGASPVA